MASRALGAMFGGLEKFLLQRRALQQDTQDREFLAKNRDLALRRGEQDLETGGVNLGMLRTTAADQPTRLGLERLGLLKALGGAEGIDEGAVASSGVGEFGSGLMAGIRKEQERNAIRDRILGSQATSAENDATGSTIRTGALQKVASDPSLDPTSNRGDLTTFNLAGVSGGPTYGQTVQTQKDLQKAGFAHAAAMQRAGFGHDESMQGRSFIHQVEMADRTLPPGLDVRVATMLESSLKQLENQADQVSRELNMLDREIYENTTRMNQLRGSNTPGMVSPQVAQYEAAIKSAQQNKIARIQQVERAAAEVDKMISGMGIDNPQTLGYVNSRRQTALATLAQPPVDTTTTGPTVKKPL